MRQQKGCYHDAVYVKRSAIDVLLHETLGGGFSPPAVARMRRQARAAKRERGWTAPTHYTTRGRLSYLSHHTQRLSLSVVKANSRGIIDSYRKLSASLARA